MTYLRQFTAIIEREDDLYVALCPELDIASQGESITAARDNLAEAITFFCEVASPIEVETRLRRETSVYTNDEASAG